MKKAELEAKMRNILSEEEFEYWKALLKVKRILPTTPPQHWSEENFQYVKALWSIIFRRLSRFNDGNEQRDLRLKSAVMTGSEKPKRPPTKFELWAEQHCYQLSLQRAILILPLEPPKELTVEGVKILKTLSTLIFKRGSWFEGGEIMEITKAHDDSICVT